MSIPLDPQGIVITTPRNQTNLFYTNVSIDSTIGQRQEYGVTDTYFSSFDIFPRDAMEQVILNCNVPIGFDYVPDNFACEATAAPVMFGDIDLDDLNNILSTEDSDFLPANLISFRFFTVYTPDTTAWQLTYYSYANPEAIVHMRLGLFKTNTSYVDSYSALPEYQLLSFTKEIELVNVDESLIIANLVRPVRLIQGATYAIGVWTDSLVYGPQADWGVNAAGLPLPYNTVSRDGDFPKAVFALGGQTGTQPMAVVACAANQQIIHFQWCATFADYYEIFGIWYLERRFYEGVLYGLSHNYTNEWGTYYILTAGNGTFWSTVTQVPPPPPPALREYPTRSSPHRLAAPLYSNATWNLNNFQEQSPDFLYTSTRHNLQLDEKGMQIIINVPGSYGSTVFAVILQAVRGRGSPVWQYQESIEYGYEDGYSPEFNSGNEFHALMGADLAHRPTCPLLYVPWDLIYPGDEGFIIVCNGLAQMQSTYGDNKVFDYREDAEGNTVQGQVLYTINFTATAGTLLQQVSFDVLNNTMLDVWVSAYIGLYNASDGSLLSQIIPFEFLEVLDMMVVGDLNPPVYVPVTGLYIVAVKLSQDYHVATSSKVGPSMRWGGEGLPSTFTPDGVSPLLPVTAYGCVTASHYFCGSFQYYLGDDYSPIAIDYLYQGLILQQPFGPYNNSMGSKQPVLYAAGHLSVFARIARYAYNFHQGVTDVLLTNPGNSSYNYFYSWSQDGATLDELGLNFLTSDDFGYPVNIIYNSTTQTYHDSTNAQLGDEILTSWTLAPINFTVGIPQCSFLDLAQVVSPVSALSNASYSCDSNSLVWGNVNSADYFYHQEGEFSSVFNLITLSPFNTGPENSSVSTLALGLYQNGNVFAHIRMALYDLQDALLAESNEVTVDNPQDVVLYFTLNQTVLLRPASTYYIAYWTDVALYSAAGAVPTALCYYGIQYGYDLQPWPPSVGSKEAEYTACKPLPVAALACQVAVGPPPLPPECPVVPDCPALTSSTAMPPVTPTSAPSTVTPPAPTSAMMTSDPYAPTSTPTLPPFVTSTDPSAPTVPTGGPAPYTSSSSSYSPSATPAPGPDDEKSEGVGVGTVVGIVILMMVLTAVVTAVSVYSYLTGKCRRGGSADNGSGLLSGESDTSTGSRFSRMTD